MTRVLIISFTTFFLTLTLWTAKATEEAGGYPAHPMEVGKAFLTAYAKGDYKKAKRYVTTESHEAMDMLIETMKDHKPKKFKLKVGQIRIENRTAALEYFKDGEPKELSMALVSGQWRVIFTKDETAEESMGASKKGKNPKAHESDLTKAAKAFLDAWAARDYKKAKRYISPETEEAYDMMVAILEADTAPPPVRIVLQEIKEEAETATVTYLQNDEVKTLDMVEVEGNWFVAFVKASPTDDEEFQKALEEIIDSAFVDTTADD
jgi:hypothetical protein